MAKLITIDHDGEVETHIGFEKFGYVTLCGMDGDDPDKSVMQKTVVTPSRAKITCSHCKSLWDRAMDFKLSDFSTTLRAW